VVIVLVQSDREQSELAQLRFECRRELALLLPILLRDVLLEHLDRRLQLRMERSLFTSSTADPYP